jgi:anaerobic magnesium-protoporphyrin IX monomethyl ester cyclase
MNILLIAPPIMDYIDGKLTPIAMDAGFECPPYGIYLLSSILKAAGHDVVLADLIARGTCDIGSYLSDIENSSLVGIGATSLSWPTAVEVIKQIRLARKDLPIVLGGIHPTMFDKYILRNFPVDFIIRGEAEIALPALCTAVEQDRKLEEVSNLSWRDHNGEIIRNEIGPIIPAEKLSSFPLPDYDMLPTNVYKGLSMESSRGCAFDCAFCSTSYRRTWRGIPAEQFADRLEKILPYLDRTTNKTLHIVDDEFSTNPKRAIEIAEILKKRELYPSLVYDCRASDILFEGFVENLADLTCQFLVGAECGYDEGLKRIGKGTTLTILEEAAAKLKKHGMSERADFSFIIGLPWETIDDIKKTIRFASHLLGTYGVRTLLQWYCQIPGSRLWEEDRRNQVVNEAMYDNFGFFRNLYLFRSGVRLSPKDIWDVSYLVAKLQWLSSMRYEDNPMIEFGFPEAIAVNYPKDNLSEEDSGLFNLRQVAKPIAKAGFPI